MASEQIDSNVNPATTSENKVMTFANEVTEKNLPDMIRLNEKLKPHKIKCFQVAIELLEKIGVKYFIADGTLLAAYRDGGTFIPHDLDTDLGIMEEELHTVWKNRHLLPEGYRWDTKCPSTGMEWCDENGCKPFDPATKGAKEFTIYDTTDYAHLLEAEFPQVKNLFSAVCTDLYTYTKIRDDPPLLRLNWAKGNHGLELKRFQYDWIFPRRKFVFEGIECWGPRDPETWLKELYGYIGRDAYYDTEEHIWKKKD